MNKLSKLPQQCYLYLTGLTREHRHVDGIYKFVLKTKLETKTFLLVIASWFAIYWKYFVIIVNKLENGSILQSFQKHQR